MIEDSVLILLVAVRAEWFEQDPAERLVVEGVVVAALGREFPASVAFRPRTVEAVDGGADDLAAAGPEHGGEFVGQRGLAGCVWAVDGDPGRVPGRCRGLDCGGEAVEEFAAGA